MVLDQSLLLCSIRSGHVSSSPCGWVRNVLQDNSEADMVCESVSLKRRKKTQNWRGMQDCVKRGRKSTPNLLGEFLVAFLSLSLVVKAISPPNVLFVFFSVLVWHISQPDNFRLFPVRSDRGSAKNLSDLVALLSEYVVVQWC